LIFTGLHVVFEPTDSTAKSLGAELPDVSVSSDAVLIPAGHLHNNHA